MANILICDDERDIVSALKIYLSAENYTLFEAFTGREALDIVRKNDIHLILMDIMMPEMDGISATAKLREEFNIPIILLTAKSEDTDKVLGLNVGADDYITKPFGVMELISRVRALLRRSGEDKGEKSLTIGKILLDGERHAVYVDGVLCELTYKEYELLRLLMQRAGIVTTREEILNHVWGSDFQGESRTLDMHIKTLRQKLGEAGGMIRTVRSVGYFLENDGSV